MTDPRLSELAARAAAARTPSDPGDISAALKRVRRNIAHSHGHPAVLEREFGTLVLAALAWMGAYRLDPAACITAAQRAHPSAREGNAATPADVPIDITDSNNATPHGDGRES